MEFSKEQLIAVAETYYQDNEVDFFVYTNHLFEDNYLSQSEQKIINLLVKLGCAGEEALTVIYDDTLREKIVKEAYKIVLAPSELLKFLEISGLALSDDVDNLILQVDQPTVIKILIAALLVKCADAKNGNLKN